VSETPDWLSKALRRHRLTPSEQRALDRRDHEPVRIGDVRVIQEIPKNQSEPALNTVAIVIGLRRKLEAALVCLTEDDPGFATDRDMRLRLRRSWVGSELLAQTDVIAPVYLEQLGSLMARVDIGQLPAPGRSPAEGEAAGLPVTAGIDPRRTHKRAEIQQLSEISGECAETLAHVSETVPSSWLPIVKPTQIERLRRALRERELLDAQAFVTLVAYTSWRPEDVFGLDYWPTPDDLAMPPRSGRWEERDSIGDGRFTWLRLGTPEQVWDSVSQARKFSPNPRFWEWRDKGLGWWPYWTSVIAPMMSEIGVRFGRHRLRLTYQWLMAASGGDSESMSVVSRGDPVLATYLTSMSWRERLEALDADQAPSRTATQLIAAADSSPD
jgi:hypothetical protein